MSTHSTPPLPRWADLFLLPLINLTAAFVICGIIIAIIGENPFHAISVMLKGAFVYKSSLGYTLYYTTNFIFTGLAVAIAFHAMLFNIGGEGQAYIGGIGAAIVALTLGADYPAIVVMPVAVLSAALFGAAWAFIPAYLQAMRDSHIVITTIMFNFLAASLVNSLMSTRFTDGTRQPGQTRLFDEGGVMWSMQDLLASFGIEVAKSPLNVSFILALMSLFAFWVLVWKTKFGYSLRATGHNPDASHYAGINVPRVVIIAMLISGAFAGLMATNIVLGAQQKFALSFTGGFGFTGIAVALMGRNHPVGIFLAALLFGALFQGGAELDFEFQSITREMVLVIQGMIILFSGALAYMFNDPLAALLGKVLKTGDDT